MQNVLFNSKNSKINKYCVFAVIISTLNLILCSHVFHLYVFRNSDTELIKNILVCCFISLFFSLVSCITIYLERIMQIPIKNEKTLFILNNIIILINFNIGTGLLYYYNVWSTDSLMYFFSFHLLYNLFVTINFRISWRISIISHILSFLIHIMNSYFFDIPFSFGYFFGLLCSKLLLILFEFNLERIYNFDSKVIPDFKNEIKYLKELQMKFTEALVVFNSNGQFEFNTKFSEMISNSGLFAPLHIEKDIIDSAKTFLEILIGNDNNLQELGINLNNNVAEYLLKESKENEIRTENGGEEDDNELEFDIDSNFVSKEKIQFDVLSEKLDETKNSLKKIKVQKYMKRKLNLECFHSTVEKYSTDFNYFVFLKTVTIEISNISTSYEVWLRTSFDLKRFEYIIKNVTEEIRRINEDKKLKYKSLCLAKIAHEFKNPIITICNLCQNISNKVNSLNQQNISNITYQSSDEDSDLENDNSITKRSSVGSVKNSIVETSEFLINTGNYVMSLIEDLNYFSKMENNLLNENKIIKSADNNEYFSILKTVEFCFKIFKLRQKFDENKKRLKFLTEIDKRIPNEICSNELKFKQILINLLSNAYKFTSVGLIKLTLNMEKKEFSNYIRFEVSDTGSGIPKEKIKSICEPFTVNEKNQYLNSNGSGLGLFIVKDLLSQIGSELDINSEEGVGSKFSFYFEIKNINLRKNFGYSKKNSGSTIRKFQPVMCDSLKNIYSVINHSKKNNFNNNVSDSFSGKYSKEVKFKDVDSKDTLFFSSSPISHNKRGNVNSIHKTKSNNSVNFFKIFGNLDPIPKNSYSNINNISKRSSNLIINMCRPSLNLYSKFNEYNISQRSTTPKNTMNRHESRKKLNEIAEINEFRCSLKIMICDDDTSVRVSMKRNFNKCAEEKRIFLDIEETINGLECLYKIYSDFLVGNKYDIIFMDENMPFMKGSLAANILKNMSLEGHMNKLRLISISCFEDDDIQTFLKEQGFNEFLKKPHTKETISKFLDQFINN